MDKHNEKQINKWILRALDSKHSIVLNNFGIAEIAATLTNKTTSIKAKF